MSYSDGVTPSVTYGYDRLARQNSVTWNGVTDTLTYNLANELLGESFAGGPLNGFSVTNGYDQFLRRTTLATNSPLSNLTSTAYGYDAASRLGTVNDGNGNLASYSYLANSPLVGQIVFTNNGAVRMTTTKQYDFLNRLTQISSAPGAAYVLPLAFNYNYNPANQRTKDTLADGSYWIYAYDSLGQVTNGCKCFANGTPVAGQQFDYAFDTIGNRTQTLSGGDQTGANLRVANYTNNTLNQITSRDVPPFVDVMGASILTNAVTVNGQTAYRNQEYYRQQLPANNGASALWTNIVVSGGQSVTGNVYVAREPENFRYDADGNLTNDGRWAYTWDAENRLIGMTTNTTVGPPYQLAFAYDPKGRRIQKTVTNGIVVNTLNFLYDGWNLVAILNPQSSILDSFVWGSDLSGSMQGAGGVGGLLEVSYHGSSTTNCFPAFDGNGNLAALVNTADGTIVANYEYGPFGEVIRATGPMAKANPIRFSTKYDDDESDLLYYGYRYYRPSTGTWLNRDPIGEYGGYNNYSMIRNNPISRVDLLGLSPTETNPPKPGVVCTYCKCKSLLSPTDKMNLKMGFYNTSKGKPMYGAQISSSWDVDGDKSLCVYEIMEKAGLVTGSDPTGPLAPSVGSSQYPGGWQPAPGGDNVDSMGIPVVGNGEYTIDATKLTQTYRCIDSDDDKTNPKHPMDVPITFTSTPSSATYPQATTPPLPR